MNQRRPSQFCGRDRAILALARTLALGLLVALIVGVFGPVASAAAPPARKAPLPIPAPQVPEAPPEGAARFPYDERMKLGAQTLVLTGGVRAPLGFAPGLAAALQELATLRVGETLDCWTLFDTDVFRPFPENLRRHIRDGSGIPVGGLEAEAWEKVVVQCSLTSPKAFAGAANKTLSYAHLYNHPEVYRGEVAHISGRLVRVNVFRPPGKAANEGVHELFEAWIANESLGAHPYCVTFTDWPAGLSRNLLGQLKIERKVYVAFDGYFFKKFRYEAADSKRGTFREAPLLLGNSLVVLPGAPSAPVEPSDSGWVTHLLYVFLGLLAGVVCLIVGLTYWFRRSDRLIQRRLQAARHGELVLPPPDAMPVAAPVAPFAGADKQRAQLAAQSAATRWGDRMGERGGQPPSGKGTGESIEGKESTGPGPDPGEDAGA